MPAQCHFGSEEGPLLLLHAGAGSLIGHEDLLEERNRLLQGIAEASWPLLRDGGSALEAVHETVRRLEAEPVFNAGHGAYVQSDGLCRLTASMMDGARRKFSAVSLATHLRHPSALARALQERDHTMLGPLGAQLLARELGMPPENPVTPKRAQQWADYILAQSPPGRSTGTVGAVARDAEGRLAAATSTGGHQTNPVERMSDVSTPAGNYASERAAISCTGVGEEIVDDGLAVRIETRVRDGAALDEACTRCCEEGEASGHQYGWIALDPAGAWAACHTTPHMPAALASRSKGCRLLGGKD